MVGVDYGSLKPVQADSQPKASGLVLGRRLLGAVLHSSNEPGELLQWHCHDDSTINTVSELLLLLTRMITIFCVLNSYIFFSNNGCGSKCFSYSTV